MSIKDLEKAGLLLPRDQWGRYDVHSRVNRVGLMASWILAAASAVFMYVGNGRTLTWVGVIGMAVFLAWFTYLSIHAIHVRNQASAHAEASRDLDNEAEAEAAETISDQ